MAEKRNCIVAVDGSADSDYALDCKYIYINFYKISTKLDERMKSEYTQRCVS